LQYKFNIFKVFQTSIDIINTTYYKRVYDLENK
jgi:hypothetical protein